MSLFGEPDPVLKKLSSSSRIYKKVEERYNITRRNSFKTLVSPSRWESNPFDRWYKYKEGYSSLLIHGLLNEFDAKPNDPVLDPFLGCGTTLCGASTHGILRGFGIEVNPFSYMLSRVKLRKYNNATRNAIVSDIKHLFSGFKDWKNENEGSPFPELSIVNKLFGNHAERIVDIITFMKEVENEVSREFLLSGLGCILEQLSYAKKDGNGLRYPPGKKPVSIASTLKEQYKMMLEDIRKHGATGEFSIVNGDTRNITYKNAIDGEIKHVIFSPPYANCFDYVEVYKIELWMLDFVKEYADLKDLRDCTLSSHLNKTYDATIPKDPLLKKIFSLIDWKKTWGGEKTSHMLVNYFDDMEKVFKNITSVLAPGGTVTCVVGNSAYDFVPIATDLLLARLMEKCGLAVTEIRVARPLLSSVQQKKKMGRNKFMRESLVMSRKR